MGYTKVAVLADNESGLTVGDGESWAGGVGALVYAGTSFPTTCRVQIQLPNNAWLDVGAANITANGLESLDLPAGRYRLNKSGGTATALYVRLISIPR